MSFYTQLYVDYEEIDKRLVLCNVSFAVPGVLKMLPSLHQDLKFLSKAGNAPGCRPLFVFFKSGMCVGAVTGLNTPGMKLLIDTYLPPAPKDDE